MRLSGVLTSLVLLAALGCSPHQDPPATPAMRASTPTYRSTVNSTDVVQSPYYIQPGLNGGKRVVLAAIPSQARFSGNSPLALSVYAAIQADTSIAGRYIVVEARGSRIRLQGTVPTRSQAARAEALARKVEGVKGVDNELQAR